MQPVLDKCICHKEWEKAAVKIQYPGVANSIGSDLALVKPVATRMFNLKGQDTEKFFKEIEGNCWKRPTMSWN